MTLQVTSDKIYIKNGNGTTKFTSDNKLVYAKYSANGSVTVSNATVKVPFARLDTKDFVVVTITISSSTGNVNGNTGTTGKKIPANGSILTHVDGRASGNSGICDIEFIGVNVCGDSLVFNGLYFTYDGIVSKPKKSTTFDYNAVIYSYL